MLSNLRRFPATWLLVSLVQPLLGENLFVIVAGDEDAGGKSLCRWLDAVFHPLVHVLGSLEAVALGADEDGGEETRWRRFLEVDFAGVSADADPDDVVGGDVAVLHGADRAQHGLVVH